MRTALAGACALLTFVSGERRVLADPAEAQDFAARALKRAQEGDRRGAIDFLEKAYDADPAPDFLLQIADQYEALAVDEGEPLDLRLALSHLREYLAYEKNATQIQAVRTRLQALRERLIAMPPRPAARTIGPAARRRAEVAVNFLPVDGADSFHVSLAGKSCTTPCTLQLLPGLYSMETSGADQLKLDLNVPDTPGVVHLATSGNRFFAPGVALTVLGPIVAASLWAIEFACPIDGGTGFVNTTCTTANLVVWPVVGAGMFFTGIGLLAYYGNHMVNRAQVEVASVDPPAEERPHFRFASAGFQPVHNGGAAGVAFTF